MSTMEINITIAQTPGVGEKACRSRLDEHSDLTTACFKSTKEKIIILLYRKYGNYLLLDGIKYAALKKNISLK